MKKKVLVDMDGVLADVYKPLIKMQYIDKGLEMNESMLNGVAEREAFEDLVEIVTSKGFFRTAPVIEGSVQGLQYLNERYDVLVVSSATEFSGCLDDKQAWLMEHFPFIGWQQMIFCGRKSDIVGDIMIDDHPKNLSHFAGTRYMFTQPHNYYLDEPTYQRVDSWEQIMKLL